MASVSKGFIGFSDCTDEEYFSSGALTSTGIKKMKVSPAHFKAYLDGRMEPTETQKSNFNLGHCVHDSIILNNTDRFLEGPDVSSKAVKAWKEAKAEADDQGKILLSPKEYKQVHEMFDAFCEHPKAPTFIDQCDKREVPGFYKDDVTGLWCGFKCDGFRSQKPIIFDYKTIADCNESTITSQIIKYGYHISAAHYIAGVEALTGEKVEFYYLVFQEKTVPYDVIAIPLREEIIEQGRMARRVLLNKIADCMDKDDWPGRSPGLFDLEIPHYLLDKEDAILEGISA